MSLPPAPIGYDNWNDYIKTEAWVSALAQGLTLSYILVKEKLSKLEEQMYE